MHNKTKGALIGGAIGMGLAGPFGAAAGAVLGGLFCNCDILDEFKDSVKAHVKQYCPDGFAELTKEQWENLYAIQRDAHEKEVAKYGKKKATITKKYLKQLVDETIEEIRRTGACA